MAGTKVSQLSAATNPSVSDLLYLINAGNPRSITLSAFISFLLANNIVTSVNGHTGVSGAVTVTKADVGLSLVPNAVPVGSVNTLTGAVVLAAGNGIALTPVGNTITLNVSGLTNAWGSMTGSITNQGDLAAQFASLGVQQGIRAVTVSSNFLSTDITNLWISCNSALAMTMNIPIGLGTAVGALIEVRQAGSGVVTIISDVGTTLFAPNGIATSTAGVGTRIQLVNIGTDSWEYR